MQGREESQNAERRKKKARFDEEAERTVKLASLYSPNAFEEGYSRKAKVLRVREAVAEADEEDEEVW